MAQKLLKLWKINFVIILICLLFLITRLYKISEIPSSVYWDEASIGYNAYSVLKTGRDEWGEFLPLHFRAFGEFKLPVYIYSVAISEFFFGLTPYAVRLPAVIFGLLSVIGLYLLVLRLTDNKLLSLLSSFLFSITPWFFIFSRTGYEAVAGLSFFIWAIYLLLLVVRHKFLFVISTFLFILSAYSYNSFRILTPIILGVGLLYYLIRKNYVAVFVSVLILLASMFPLYKLYRKDSGLSRLQTVGSKNIIQNYIKNFSPSYLFVIGDTNPRSQMPNHGQLYYLDILFLTLGILYILQSKNSKLYFILCFLLLAPIPAATTKENPHALRAILMSPVLAVISAMGIYYLTKSKKLLLVIIVGAYLFLFVSYFSNFISNYNNLSKSAWQYEYKEIFEKQKSGCVSDEFAQPYIFALYYNKFDVNEFIRSRELNPVSDWGFSTVKSFGNFDFPKICKN
ncbi:MAG: Glycosyl transferase family 39 [uncultured bacterium]|nr:MAG: Glycosyl transferase family 39 [uncultured bacterium]